MFKKLISIYKKKPNKFKVYIFFILTIPVFIFFAFSFYYNFLQFTILPIFVIAYKALTISKWKLTSSENKESLNITNLLVTLFLIDSFLLISLTLSYFIASHETELFQKQTVICNTKAFLDRIFSITFVSIYVGSLLFSSFISLLQGTRFELVKEKIFIPLIGVIIIILLIESLNIILYSIYVKYFGDIIYSFDEQIFTRFNFSFIPPIACIFATLIVLGLFLAFAVYIFTCVYWIIIVIGTVDKINK